MKFTEFKSKLKQFLSSSGVSQNALSIKADVPQSQVCNWANGKGCRYTKNARKVIIAIENYQKENECGYFSIPDDLQQSIRLVLDGNPERKKVLVDMIKSLDPILKKL